MAISHRSPTNYADLSSVRAKQPGIPSSTIALAPNIFTQKTFILNRNPYRRTHRRSADSKHDLDSDANARPDLRITYSPLHPVGTFPLTKLCIIESELRQFVPGHAKVGRTRK